MYCPSCGHPQHCPCPACVVNFPTNDLRWVNLEKGTVIACGKCNLTQPADWWAELEYDCLIGTGK